MKFEVKPFDAALGAEIVDINLTQADKETCDQIRAIWMQHQVLRFRGQKLSDARLVTFSTYFGELDIAPPNENGSRFVEGFPEILVLSNVVENGELIGSLGSGEAVWHTDMSYIPAPPMGSALYAWEVPESGGDTSFLNMYAALEQMPNDLRSRIKGLKIKHDGTTNSAGYQRYGMEGEVDIKTSPGMAHDIVIKHPETGRDALYLGRRFRAYVQGLLADESEVLLDELWQYVDQDKFVWRQQWLPGDLIMWDNRCVMHKRDAFAPDARRIMHRTQIKAAVIA